MNIILRTILLLIINLKTNTKPTPVRLQKPIETSTIDIKPLLPIILLGIGVLLTMFILAWIILQTGGSMESTGMYNRLIE